MTDTERPNIVLIVMDTARADETELGAPDSTPMPNLVELARAGVRFTDVSANAPWTLPSHATMFSGRPPSVHDTHVHNKQFSWRDPLPVRMRDAGYETLGVSNNTWISGEFGFERGFDDFVATWKLFQSGVDFGGASLEQWGVLDRLCAVLSRFRGNPMKNLANLAYGRFFRKRDDDGAKRTNSIVSDRLSSLSDGDSPFFLFLNYLEPHLEYRPPEPYADRFLPSGVTLADAYSVNQDAWAYITGDTEMSERDFEILRRLYRAELAYLDDRIDELVETFKTHGCQENTVFIVTGDHGENIGEHGLMDHQYSLHETLLDVPMAVWGPGFPEETVVDAPIQLADVYATILEIAGVPEHGNDFAQPFNDLSKIGRNRTRFAEYLGPQPPIDTLRERYDCQRDLSKYDRWLRAAKRDGGKVVLDPAGRKYTCDLAEETDDGNSLEGGVNEWEELADELTLWIRMLPEVSNESVAMSDGAEERLEQLGYLQ